MMKYLLATLVIVISISTYANSFCTNVAPRHIHEAVNTYQNDISAFVFSHAKLSAANTLLILLKPNIATEDQNNSLLLISFCILGVGLILIVINLILIRKNLNQPKQGSHHNRDSLHESESSASNNAHLLQSISTEILTPITLLLTPLENLAKRTDLSDEIKNDLKVCLRSSQSLRKTATGMYDLSQVYDGDIILNKQPIDITMTLDQMIQTGLLAENVHFEAEDKSLIANIDFGKFERILIGIINTGLKSPESKTITAKDDSGDLVVEIKGSKGSSTDLEQLNGLFPSFSEREPNMPLGIMIAKEFISLHDGQLNLSVTGNDFVITLTFSGAIYKSGEEDSLQKSESDKPTIMLVEDQAAMRFYLKKNLVDFRIIEASDGQNALDLLKQGVTPNLIVSDYMMPRMDGYHFAQALKEDPQLSQIPIIFLSAVRLSSDKVKVLNLGIDDYIVKPFDMEELIARIQNVLKISAERQDFAKSNTPDIPLEKQGTFKKELDTYILDNLENHLLSPADLSSQFSISDRNLHRRIKLVTGQPPASYIRELRLQKARLILESEKEISVSEAAIACGLPNLPHFSQAFKKRFGTTPSAFQEKQNLVESNHP